MSVLDVRLLLFFPVWSVNSHVSYDFFFISKEIENLSCVPNPFSSPGNLQLCEQLYQKSGIKYPSISILPAPSLWAMEVFYFDAHDQNTYVQRRLQWSVESGQSYT